MTEYIKRELTRSRVPVATVAARVEGAGVGALFGPFEEGSSAGGVRT